MGARGARGQPGRPGPVSTSPESEQFWPGQSQELFGKLSGRPAIVAFTQAEEADSHCEPMASGIRGVSGSSTGSTGRSRPDPGTAAGLAEATRYGVRDTDICALRR